MVPQTLNAEHLARLGRHLNYLPRYSPTSRRVRDTRCVSLLPAAASQSVREEKRMKRTRFFSILALIVLVAGCAGPSARVGSSESGEDGSALPAARELSGTWHGSYW